MELILQITEIVLVVIVLTIVLWRLRETSIMSFVPILIVIGLFYMVSTIFNFEMLSAFVSVAAVFYAMAIAIVLQDEFKQMFRRVQHKQAFGSNSQEHLDNATLQGAAKAVIELSNRGDSAMIVFNKGKDVTDYKKTGKDIGATQLRFETLVSLFASESPLNQGAAIIEDEFITTTSVRLPKSQNPRYGNMPHTLQSAIGLIEIEDVVVITVSGEESGVIRIIYQDKNSEIQIDTYAPIGAQIASATNVKYGDLAEYIRRKLDMKVDKVKVQKRKPNRESSDEKRAKRDAERQRKREERDAKRGSGKGKNTSRRKR